MQQPFVTKIDAATAQKLHQILDSQGFVFSKPPHTQFQGQKKGVSCTLYESGKLVVQGKDKEEFITYTLEPEVLKTFTYGHESRDLDPTPRIGVDESGKGDFFGPLCVAALFASGNDVNKLHELGVKDCKALSDKKILSIASKLRQSFQHHIIAIGPQKYNELYAKFCNLNSLLAWGHATAISELSQKTQCKNVIIDQFAHENVVKTALKKKGVTLDLLQKHRAEEDIVVAGASILARASFLTELEKLSERCGIPLPKGASSATLEAGRQFLSKWGQDPLTHVAKCHFKTYNEILKFL
ncbi:MAG: ribonuclease HIII [Chlamydiia bacterium]|nr:ribonuclease HIII [Chlamydiia bacterium]